jgi:hypothetical protein
MINIKNPNTSILHPAFRFGISDCGFRIVLKTAPISQRNQPETQSTNLASIQYPASSILYPETSIQQPLPNTITYQPGG